MRVSQLRLTYLFERYYYKTATPEETRELFDIINTGQYDEELAVISEQLWSNSHPELTPVDLIPTERILNDIFEAGTAEAALPNVVNITTRKRTWWRIAVAAAILLLTGLSIYLFCPVNNATNTLVLTRSHSKHDALPGSNKAYLRLGNGKTILLDDASKGVLAKQGLISIKKTADGQLTYQYTKASNAAPVINVISTPKGGQYQINLSDGTRVWLNAASSIKFPTCFTGHLRQVEITGEAYFEVAKNKVKPFEVHTSRGDIKVLGTHFNVMDYGDEKQMKTTLLEGSVVIQHQMFSGKLKPGQQAVINYSGRVNIVDDVDVEEEIAWKKGIFQFNDSNVDDIMRQMARWYDLNMVYRGNIPQKRFTGHISRKVKASELLDMLNYSGIKIHIDNSNLILD